MRKFLYPAILGVLVVGASVVSPSTSKAQVSIGVGPVDVQYYPSGSYLYSTPYVTPGYYSSYYTTPYYYNYPSYSYYSRPGISFSYGTWNRPHYGYYRGGYRGGHWNNGRWHRR